MTREGGMMEAIGKFRRVVDALLETSLAYLNTHGPTSFVKDPGPDQIKILDPDRIHNMNFFKF